LRNIHTGCVSRAQQQIAQTVGIHIASTRESYAHGVEGTRAEYPEASRSRLEIRQMDIPQQGTACAEDHIAYSRVVPTTNLGEWAANGQIVKSVAIDVSRGGYSLATPAASASSSQSEAYARICCE
jgi:hypothetical protein